MPHLRPIVIAAIMFWTLTGSVTAQPPSFRAVTGHDFGQRITQHHEMLSYLERLAGSSPRVTVLEQGETWEGRKLVVAIVTSPENHRRLDEIRATGQRLADPRATSTDEAARLIADQPAIVWIGGSIHGFELSGSEGVLKLLERLATAEDEATRRVLRDAVILIDPMLNPDGRDAFAQINHQNIGREPNSNRDDWANDFTSWQALKFRTGHYYFDTNRDWFAHTQRETRARVPTIQDWRPQVVIDAHEMGADVEFYFDPATEPYGPFFPNFAFEWFQRFGERYAAAFDSAGFEYMTRERYNYFYPGYTTSFGSYQGAVGMLYEQGSSRGLALTRADRSVRTLADALEHQYLAAWTAVRAAAAEREALLREYHDAHRRAIADGRSGIRRYLIAPEGDPQLVAELANLLMRNGIEVSALTTATRLDDVRDRTGASLGRRQFPAGTYVIEAAQPRNRLARVLLEPQVPLPDEFLSEARARVDRDENPRFYDITAWSLPLLFDVGGYSTSDARSLEVQRLTGPVRTAAIPADRARYAYLIDGAQAAALGALYELRARGYRVAVLTAPTRIEGRDFHSGTVVVRVGQNDESVHEAVREIAKRRGLRLDAVATGLSEPGFPALGSGDEIIPVLEPKIALLAEDPIHAYSFGWAWYTLDRQYEIATTVLRVRSVSETPLERYSVVVIPELIGGANALVDALGDSGVARIRRWVRDGGTLVAIGDATEFARNSLELIELRSWYETEAGEEAQRFDVPGAVLRARLDPGYWMSAGYDRETLPVLVNSTRIYLAPEGPPSSSRRVIAAYAQEPPLRLSGHAWSESLERLPGAVFLYEERVGGGRVIAFAEDPNFRAYWRGANRLFLNAVVLGPSAP